MIIVDNQQVFLVFSLFSIWVEHIGNTRAAADNNDASGENKNKTKILFFPLFIVCHWCHFLFCFVFHFNFTVCFCFCFFRENFLPDKTKWWSVNKNKKLEKKLEKSALNSSSYISLNYEISWFSNNSKK